MGFPSRITCAIVPEPARKRWQRQNGKKMIRPRTRPSLGPALYFLLAFTLCSYFIFAAVQGDYGLFRRIQVDADAEVLKAERDRLVVELTVLANKTHRLSDNYLDLDLLDEQARDVLGSVRTDELVIR